MSAASDTSPEHYYNVHDVSRPGASSGTVPRPAAAEPSAGRSGRQEWARAMAAELEATRSVLAHLATRGADEH
jgi:hypothetical protein